MGDQKVWIQLLETAAITSAMTNKREFVFKKLENSSEETYVDLNKFIRDVSSYPLLEEEELCSFIRIISAMDVCVNVSYNKYLFTLKNSIIKKLKECLKIVSVTEPILQLFSKYRLENMIELNFLENELIKSYNKENLPWLNSYMNLWLNKPSYFLFGAPIVDAKILCEYLRDYGTLESISQMFVNDCMCNNDHFKNECHFHDLGPLLQEIMLHFNVNDLIVHIAFNCAKYGGEKHFKHILQLMCNLNESIDKNQSYHECIIRYYSSVIYESKMARCYFCYCNKIGSFVKCVSCGVIMACSRKCYDEHSETHVDDCKKISVLKNRKWVEL